MRVRHKQPTLVSMWMLDVFCCALGCVTLLWLLNTRQAGDQASAAKAAMYDLQQTRTDLATARSEYAAARLRLNSEVRDLTGRLTLAEAERDDTAARLATAETQLNATRVRLAVARANSDTLVKELAAARAEAAALTTKLNTTAASAD